MPSVVVATLNVTFSEDSSSTSGEIKLEIDDREDGLNNGNTSFKPGDSAAFFAFVDSSVTLEKVTATSGGVSAAGTGTKTVDEKISFSNSDTGSLSYPPSGSVSLEWLGNCYAVNATTGALSSINSLPERTERDLKIKSNQAVCGVLRARYSSEGNLYWLKGVPKDVDESMVIAVGLSA